MLAMQSEHNLDRRVCVCVCARARVRMCVSNMMKMYAEVLKLVLCI